MSLAPIEVAADPQFDVAYVRYRTIPEGEHVTRSQREGEGVQVDFDAQSQVLGIELLDFDSETIGIARRFADRNGLLFPKTLDGRIITTRRFYVVFETGDGGGWGAYIPDLPGCVATGETREEVRQLIRGAIEMHLDGMRQDGIPVPLPAGEFIDVFDRA